MTNLVMGFSTNAAENSLQIFARSLRKVYRPDECDIVIITNTFEPYFVDLGRLGVRFVPTPNNYSKLTGKLSKSLNRATLLTLRAIEPLLRRQAPEIADAYRVLIETWHHPHFVRWFAYERFLELNQQYENVMLADVKDVVFQAPFFDASSTNEVCLCDQGLQYGKTYWDTKWYRDAFGEEALQKILGRSPLCIGTMMGPHAVVLGIVRELRIEFGKRPFHRIEQAVFNHMLFERAFDTPYNVLPNVTGPIITLCDDDIIDKFTLVEQSICRALDGTVAPVVHMYDRNDKFKRGIETAFVP